MGVFKAVTGLVGAEKILFGSDFPLLLYPRKQREADFTLFIEDIKEQGGLKEDELTLIFRENSLKLLNNAGKLN
jgi:predicted TIM-barrel fold metal-dependent hydrolase